MNLSTITVLFTLLYRSFLLEIQAVERDGRRLKFVQAGGVHCARRQDSEPASNLCRPFGRSQIKWNQVVLYGKCVVSFRGNLHEAPLYSFAEPQGERESLECGV
jgi:hypothetical protein